MAEQDLTQMAIDIANSAVRAAEAKGGASPEFLMQHANAVAQVAVARELRKTREVLDDIDGALRTKAQEGVGSVVAHLVDQVSSIARKVGRD